MDKRKLFVLLIIVALVLVAIAFTGYALVNRAVPKSVSIAENAFITDELVAIAYFDNTKFNSIKRFLRGEADSEPILSSIAEKQLIDELLYGKSNVSENLESLVFGIQFKDDAPYLHALFYGQFDWGEIEKVIGKHYSLDKVDNKHYVLEKRQPKEFVCPEDSADQKSQSIYLYQNSNWIVLSSNSDSQNQLVQRLNSPISSVSKLTDWQNFRERKLFGLGVLSPTNTVQSAGSMGRLIMGKTIEQNSEAETLFVGGAVDLINFGIELHGQVHATNDWVTEWQRKITSEVRNTAEKVKPTSPTLSKVISGVSTKTDDDTLNIYSQISSETLRSLPKIIPESLQYAFTGSSVSEEESQNEERINESPWDFKINQRFKNLPSFQKDAFSEHTLFQKKAFAVLLERVEFNNEMDAVELEIKAQMQLPETESTTFWFGSQANLSLQIDSVKDKNNIEILRDERCIKDLPTFTKPNEDAVSGFSSSNNHAYLQKKIRLNSQNTFQDVHSIHGEILFTVPVDVAVHEVIAKVGEVIEKDGVRVYITKTGKQSVTYQVSGNTERLVEVRALNALGQTLENGFSMGESLEGSNMLTSTNTYYGDVTSLEIYIASSMFSENIEFDIQPGKWKRHSEKDSNTTPRPNLPATTTLSEWYEYKVVDEELIKSLKKAALYQSGPVVGSGGGSPFWFIVQHDHTNSWSKSPQLILIVPLIESLIENYSFTRFNISSGDLSANSFVKMSPPRLTSNGEYASAIDHPTHKFTRVMTLLDFEVEDNQKFEVIEGKLEFRLPLKLEKNKLEIPKLGESVKIKGSEITLNYLSFNFSPRMSFTYAGPLVNFVNLVAITKSGEFLFPEQASLSQNKRDIDFEMRQDVDHLLLITAEEQELISYPIEIKPEYSE